MNQEEEVERFLVARGAQMLSMRRLAGGASQESWAVAVRTHEKNGDTHEREIVLRRDRGGALSTLARTRTEEYVLMSKAYEAGVTVPQPLYEPLTLGGHGAFFMEYLPGETVGRRLVRDPKYQHARRVLPAQIIHTLAKLHAIDHTQFPFLGTPRTALDLVATLEYDLDACGEGHPAFELGLRWLRVNAAPLEHIRLVHGDFRMGNFVVDADGLRGILDWELTHVGDPVEDLGWLCVRAWRFGSNQLPAAGIATRDQLLDLYQEAGGLAVTHRQLQYWELFGNVKWGIIALSQAMRHLRGDILDVELATLGRVAAEMELETLHLLSAMGA